MNNYETLLKKIFENKNLAMKFCSYLSKRGISFGPYSKPVSVYTKKMAVLNFAVENDLI